MDFLLRRSGVVVSLFVLALSAPIACGARTGSLDDRFGGATPIQDGGSGDARADADGDIALDAGPEAQAPALRLCAFDASPSEATAVLAIGAASKLVYVHSDRSQVDAHTIEDAPDRGLLSLVASRERVFVATEYTAPPRRAYALLLDTSETVAWERNVSDLHVFSASSGVTMNDRGVVAVRAQTVDAANSFVADVLLEISATGATRIVPDLAPLAPVGANDEVAVQSIATLDGAMTLGWLHPDDSIRPVSGAWTGGSHFATDGARFVFLDETGAQLVVETQTDRRAVALPHAVAREERVSLAGHWAVVGDIRVDLDASRAETITAPPPGLRRFEGATRMIEEDGTLFDALRDAYLGGIYRSSDLGATWILSSGAIRLASELRATASSGTYVTIGEMTFGGEQQWPAPPPGRVAQLTGTGWTVARPSMDRIRVLETSDGFGLALSKDGLCAAYVETDDDGAHTLRVWDLQTDRTFDILRANGPVTAAWIEAPSALVTSQ